MLTTRCDFKAMTEEEQKLFRLYGKLPSKKDILKNKLKVCSASFCELSPPPSHIPRATSTPITSGQSHPAHCLTTYTYPSGIKS